MAPKGKPAKGKAASWQQTYEFVVEYAKPIVQYGFIPAVIIVGMLTTKPRPTIAQLIWFG